ncbi:RagB/SusD family nutrient uptake outer membrane protein [Ferruginibacter sp. HRS2-29]|uniref:RagB/SusD family nutrient uptake outer membrane protein n=1 Tax=Ferruginibacter sp. HRS2-29 TaxID=2487334 RepID=UPI0020CF99B3|nr:RagB/SusD family nutrient uptake outer membrane protein [Ferruginibacter sp. HRS2-29]MCP9749648.1 RagB/SusD family nutrient uptake outer membrane protein [Ferruginibacter sp. HRS2-29]
MKKIFISGTVLSVAAMLALTSCKKSFVELEPKGVFLTENYYADQKQAFSGLIATYDVLRKNSGGFENMITFMNAGSDDQYAGGGGETDGAGIQGFSKHTINAQTMPGSYWGDHYQGIFRANVLLSKIGNTTMDAALKDRYIAEAKALRATYYFNLVRMFKNVPLLLQAVVTSDIYSIKQSSPDSVYRQIEKDLTEAIPNLPASINTSSEGGRYSKGAATAMLGKVYLYENKKPEAAAQFALVNGTPGGVSPFGYSLLPNFANLWVFSNKFNSESILEVTHTNASNADWGFWGGSADEGNSVNQMVGPRSYNRISPLAPDIYTGGWSFNVFTDAFYNVIKDDPRFTATVFDAKKYADLGQVQYVAGYQNTGYFVKKFLPNPSDITTGAGTRELNFQQDSYIIRLADTYLMEAEALGATGARAQALLDAVRARVGLPSVPVSLAAIKLERRLELAAEGHRFFDLVRWGDAAAALGSRGFVAGKSEVLPIPERELAGTLLVQNPGYQ